MNMLVSKSDISVFNNIINLENWHIGFIMVDVKNIFVKRCLKNIGFSTVNSHNTNKVQNFVVLVHFSLPRIKMPGKWIQII